MVLWPSPALIVPFVHIRWALDLPLKFNILLHMSTLMGLWRQFKQVTQIKTPWKYHHETMYKLLTVSYVMNCMLCIGQMFKTIASIYLRESTSEETWLLPRKLGLMVLLVAVNGHVSCISNQDDTICSSTWVL